jgi:DNA-binding NarL/FixJ family response regulator
MMLLLIDDNELVRNSLAGLLSDMYPNLEIRSFDRCEPALLLTQDHIDFVLLDFHLLGSGPGSRQETLARAVELDGWACLKAVIARFPNAKVVLMSANRREDMEPQAQVLGAHGYVEKSTQASVLLADLRRAIDVRYPT